MNFKIIFIIFTSIMIESSINSMEKKPLSPPTSPKSPTHKNETPEERKARLEKLLDQKAIYAEAKKIALLSKLDYLLTDYNLLMIMKNNKFY